MIWTPGPEFCASPGCRLEYSGNSNESSEFVRAIRRCDHHKDFPDDQSIVDGLDVDRFKKLDAIAGLVKAVPDLAFTAQEAEAVNQAMAVSFLGFSQKEVSLYSPDEIKNLLEQKNLKPVGEGSFKREPTFVFDAARTLEVDVKLDPAELAAAEAELSKSGVVIKR